LFFGQVEWDGHSGTQEVQHVGITGGVATAGTFRLAFDGATTGVLPYDASAAQVAHALNALATTGTVAVTTDASDSSDSASSARGPPSGGHRGWTVTFLDMVGDQPPLRPASAMLRGPGVSPSLTVTELAKGTEPLFDQVGWAHTLFFQPVNRQTKISLELHASPMQD
jgi:hypothetical protein